ELQNDQYMPTLDKATSNYTIDNALQNARDINRRFSEMNIIDAINVNTIDLKEKRNLVLLDFENTDAAVIRTALDDLTNIYIHYNSYTELETYETLQTPNDYESASSVYITDPNQYDLRMIRAEEAWDLTTGNPEVIIGIVDDGFYVPNDDLVTEIIGGAGNYETPAGSSGNWNIGKHGTRVSGLASGGTNNGTGSAAIGYDTKMIARRGLSVYGLKLLSDMGAKVVNGSFGSPTTSIPNNSSQAFINDMVDSGTVVVAAAGNGPASGNGTTGLNGEISNEAYSSRYYVPASYKDVISVSTVGDKNDIGSTSTDYYNWKAVHKLATEAAYPNGATYSGTSIPINESFITVQHNDSVDIVVPAYKGSPYALNNNNPNYNYGQSSNEAGLGTSFSAPIVTGTVGLMFSVNYCLTPKEVESILKLTAVKIDNMPENLPYYGRLGAGMLDAYEAVKMSKDMADEFGSVEVKDRILYRWFYKLETAPYEIKMINNDVTGNARLKFKARSNIKILSGNYSPGAGGFVHLSIDSELPLENCPPPVTIASASNNENDTSIPERKSIYQVYPTLVDKHILISSSRESATEKVNIKIYDFYGTLVYQNLEVNPTKTEFNLQNLASGIHILKVYNLDNEELLTEKFVKK
nr:S8 family peptidase [Bacteroidota bacterium]